MAQTLQELKAENEAEEANLTAEHDENVTDNELEAESSQDTDEGTETDTANEDTDKTEEDGESEAGESDESEVEEWAKGDSHESSGEKKYSGEDVGIAKARLKAKLTKKLDAKDAELEKLKAQVQELQAAPVQQSDLQKPKREDFYEADDPDEAYLDAVTDWKLNTFQAKQAAQTATAEQQRAQQEQAQKISQGVDDHLDRAAELVAKSGISVDKYRAADTEFRRAIEDVAPDAGDNIADALVARLGKGSEKVVYNMGVNSDKLAEFSKLLRSDPSGLDAYGYLVELKAELNTPVKRKTNAPAPAAEIKGNMIVNDIKKQLAKAEGSGDIQSQINLRRKLTLAGRKQ